MSLNFLYDKSTKKIIKGWLSFKLSESNPNIMEHNPKINNTFIEDYKINGNQDVLALLSDVNNLGGFSIDTNENPYMIIGLFNVDDTDVNNIIIRQNPKFTLTHNITNIINDIPCIEGNGTNTFNINIELKDYNNNHYNTNVECFAKVSRGRITDLNSNGKVQITDGYGAFTVKTVDENVENVKIFVRSDDNTLFPSNVLYVNYI